ncbi:hypothetical protein PDJAM_G00155810 [Pangasius djambal]|uniref:Uncharacterized protein n=1 Tax=Pangasius djambal TaxID=1691987 RepID=A0ACC5ZHH2_9TELE|nr:hypothetical protein [Pangasius djambal]
MRRWRGVVLQRLRWSSHVTRALALCVLTFGVLLPLCCHRCLYSYYFLKSRFLEQRSEEALRRSYVDGQEALAYWRDVVGGGAVQGDVSERPELLVTVVTARRIDGLQYHYLLQVMRRLDVLLQGCGDAPCAAVLGDVSERPELLVTVVTARRIDGLQYHYLLQVMRRLDVLLQGCGDAPCAAVLVCDVESGPQENEDAALVEKRFRVVRRGKGVDQDVNVFEKEKRDYVFCLRRSAETVKPKNVVVLEDDALPSTDFFSVVRELLGRRFVSRSLYVKLYHPERLQRYWNPEPYRILEWVGLGLCGASLILLFLAFFPRVSPPFSVPLFLFLVAYIMVGAELIGRHYLLELRRVSPQLYAVSPATECCTPAMLFPGNTSSRVAELLDAATCMRGNAKDMVLYRNAGSAHSLEPNAIQHIGAFSSVRGDVSERPELLVTVVTARRIDGLQYHYLLQVMRRLDVLLQGCGDAPCAAVLVCDVESGPQENEDAALVEKRFRVVRRGKGVDQDVNVFEKEKRDYVFCLRRSAETVKPKNVVVLEDDALPSTDFFSVVRELLSRRFVSRSLYVKLYHPERLQRYWNPEPYRILEWVGLGLCGASLILLVLAFFPRVSPPFSVPLFLFLVAYIMVGAELIGRHYLLELRRVSPQLYAVSPATECCTPAMLFPGNTSSRVAELLDAATCMRGNAKDMVLYRNAGSAHSLEPNAIQHIGAFSSVRLCVVDLSVYGVLRLCERSAVRWSRVLRPLLLINITEGRQLRRAFRSIRNALPQILVVFFLFIFSVLMFSLMALKLLGKRNLKTIDGAPNLKTIDGAPHFTNYLEIVFDLYVLVTTANSPDVMMPAYNYSSFFAIFFILYIVINTYTFMSVFLAVVYNNYKKYLKEEVRQLVRAKRRKLCCAFSLLQEVGVAGEEPTVSQTRWNQLVRLVQPDISNTHRELLWSEEVRQLVRAKRRKLCCAFSLLQEVGVAGEEPTVSQTRWNQLVRLVQPDISNTHRELLWSVCDPQSTGHIGKVAFVQLADLLNIQVITMKSRTHPLERWIPAVYQSTFSKLIHSMVQHRVFVYVYDVIILINAVFIGLDEENPAVSMAEWVFLTLYVLEILLKLYTFEPRTFFAKHQFWNCDGVSFVPVAGGYTSRQILDIVFILRVLRLIRVVDTIPRFQAIINTLIKIGAPMLTFGQLILVVYYIFAMVGMELFKGKVQYFGGDSVDPERQFCGNVLLNGSDFARNNYCKNNFNDVVSSFILLLELTVVNQWHDILK